MTPQIGNISIAVTDDVQVVVRCRYLDDRSQPGQRRYTFAYSVRIENRGAVPLQLMGRHWIITDSTGKVEEVRGAGVVGEQPWLQPGKHFEYTSGVVLPVPRGEMRGSYHMVSADGRSFDARVAPFLLSQPHSLN